MERICKNPECRKPFSTKKKTKVFCSVPCRHKYGKVKYSEEDKQYIIDHYGKIPTIQIAQKFGTTQELLRRCISHWRMTGDKRFPELAKRGKIGDVKIRMERGKRIEYVKTEEGWKRIPIGRQKKERVIKPRPVKPPKPKPVKKEKPVKVEKQPKREVRVFRTRTIDLSKKKPVMIPGNNRTVVYVNMDADPQQVIEKYQEQRKRELMGSRYGI